MSIIQCVRSKLKTLELSIRKVFSLLWVVLQNSVSPQKIPMNTCCGIPAPLACESCFGELSTATLHYWTVPTHSGKSMKGLGTDFLCLKSRCSTFGVGE